MVHVLYFLRRKFFRVQVLTLWKLLDPMADKMAFKERKDLLGTGGTWTSTRLGEAKTGMKRREREASQVQVK